MAPISWGNLDRACWILWILLAQNEESITRKSLRKQYQSLLTPKGNYLRPCPKTTWSSLKQRRRASASIGHWRLWGASLRSYPTEKPKGHLCRIESANWREFCKTRWHMTRRRSWSSMSAPVVCIRARQRKVWRLLRTRWLIFDDFCRFKLN